MGVNYNFFIYSFLVFLSGMMAEAIIAGRIPPLVGGITIGWCFVCAGAAFFMARRDAEIFKKIEKD